ncbi:hypothetical protein [Sphingorhabdus sp.]|uniref:hypothetical protein n=1 Tax=Sphingorhabdus sp. TaxID=1902408 RepID=UPI00334046F0
MGVGDVTISVKYRYHHNEKAEFSGAAFLGVTLPTASNGMGAGKLTALLPI